MSADESKNANASPADNTADPVRKTSKYVLSIVILIFVWYVVSDRLSPWTDQARIQAYVIPVSPQVSGRVLDVNVEKDQVVQPGDVLFKIDPADYKLAVETAESSLEIAGQKIGAGMANVSTAQARLVEANANLEHMQVQSVRIYELEKKHVLSNADGDKARAAVKQAKAQVASAEADLDKAKQALGKKGKDNPRIRSALAALEKAQLDLSRTSVFSPSLGGITNLQIDTGHYAVAGSPVMTFVEFENIWIQANLRENSIANIKPGTKVDIVLDVAPAKVFKGTVESLGFAVDAAPAGTIGGLAKVENKSGWLRSAQRFPVIITFDEKTPKGILRLGGQADVQFYGDSALFNGLGWVWIRVVSLFSYIY